MCRCALKNEVYNNEASALLGDIIGDLFKRECSHQRVMAMQGRSDARWEVSSTFFFTFVLVDSGKCSKCLTHSWFRILISASVERVLSCLFFYTVSICPAAGQVVENTPCPAVKFLLIFSLLYQILVYMAETLNISTVVWIFVSSAPGITLKLSANFRTRNRKYSVSGSGIVSRQISHATQNILGDAVLVYAAQGHYYQRNTSVLFLLWIAVFFQQLPDTKS